MFKYETDFADLTPTRMKGRAKYESESSHCTECIIKNKTCDSNYLTVLRHRAHMCGIVVMQHLLSPRKILTLHRHNTEKHEEGGKMHLAHTDSC